MILWHSFHEEKSNSPPFGDLFLMIRSWWKWFCMIFKARVLNSHLLRLSWDTCFCSVLELRWLALRSAWPCGETIWLVSCCLVWIPCIFGSDIMVYFLSEFSETFFFLKLYFMFNSANGHFLPKCFISLTWVQCSIKQDVWTFWHRVCFEPANPLCLSSVKFTMQLFGGPVFLFVIPVSDLGRWSLWWWKKWEGCDSSRCCIGGWKLFLCVLMETG